MSKPDRENTTTVDRTQRHTFVNSALEAEGKSDCVYTISYRNKRGITGPRRLWETAFKHTCRLKNDVELVSCFKAASPRSVWLSFDSDALSPLTNHIAVSRGEHRLLVFSKIAESTRYVLGAYFRHVLAAKDAIKFLDWNELGEVLVAPNREDLFIGGTVDLKEEAIVLYRGTIDPVVVPLLWFESQGVNAPKADAQAFSVCDFGQTVRLGKFEASTDTILYEFDSDYRRRRKKNLIQEEDSVGASIRRLRLRKNLRRTDFPPLTEKTIARIERGEIEKPQAHTVETIAARLGVAALDLASY
jgi:hypothetical protein